MEEEGKQFSPSSGSTVIQPGFGLKGSSASGHWALTVASCLVRWHKHRPLSPEGTGGCLRPWSLYIRE